MPHPCAVRYEGLELEQPQWDPRDKSPVSHHAGDIPGIHTHAGSRLSPHGNGIDLPKALNRSTFWSNEVGAPHVFHTRLEQHRHAHLARFVCGSRV